MPNVHSSRRRNIGFQVLVSLVETFFGPVCLPNADRNENFPGTNNTSQKNISANSVFKFGISKINSSRAMSEIPKGSAHFVLA